MTDRTCDCGKCCGGTPFARVVQTLPTSDQLRELLLHDGSGGLTWMPRARAWFPTDHSYRLWNARFAGKRAFGTVDTVGYMHGKMLSRSVRAHRVVFKMTHGYEPVEIDHADGDRTNNKPDNLYAANRSVNMHNVIMSARNKSGSRGVYQNRQGRWVAQICHRGKTVFLGSYTDFESARQSRATAERGQNYKPQRERAGLNHD